MEKKRGKGAIIGFVIAGLVAAAVTVFTLFFNGKYLYFTFGMNDSDIIKTDNVHLSETAAKILLADEKQAFLDVSDVSVLDQNIGDETIAKNLKSNVKSKLSRIAALVHMAGEKNISLSASQKEAVSAVADEYLAKISDQGKDFTGITKENLEDFITKYTLAEEVKNRLMSDSTVEVSTDEARVILIQYICSEDENAVKEAKKKVEAGEPFYEVAAGVNADSDFDAELSRGDTSKEIEDAAFALKTGEVSDVVLSDGKYYIIKCSSDNEQTKTDANREVLLEKAENAYFEKKFVPYENGLYFEFDDSAWNKIQFDKIPESNVKFYDIYTKYTEE